VKLTPYPQKVRTFFSLDDTNVPAGLRANGVSLPVGAITAAARAIDGATWLGTTQGLMRLDFSAPERDRRQYLAGGAICLMTTCGRFSPMSKVECGCARARAFPTSN
jgi:hypothetical protein